MSVVASSRLLARASKASLRSRASEPTTSRDDHLLVHWTLKQKGDINNALSRFIGGHRVSSTLALHFSPSRVVTTMSTNSAAQPWHCFQTFQFHLEL